MRWSKHPVPTFHRSLKYMCNRSLKYMCNPVHVSTREQNLWLRSVIIKDPSDVLAQPLPNAHQFQVIYARKAAEGHDFSLSLLQINSKQAHGRVPMWTQVFLMGLRLVKRQPKADSFLPIAFPSKADHGNRPRPRVWIAYRIISDGAARARVRQDFTNCS